MMSFVVVVVGSGVGGGVGCAKYRFVCFFCHLIVDLYITVKLLILLIIQGYLKANCGKFAGDEGCWCHI